MTPFLQSLSDETDPATPAVYLVESKRARRFSTPRGFESVAAASR